MKSRNPKTPESDLTRRGALAAVPEKNIAVIETRQESGTVMLAYPVVFKPWVAALVRRFSPRAEDRPMRRLALDELGTWVWDRLDGKRRVFEIIDDFSREQDVLPSEAEASVTRFLYELGKRGLIGLR
ncbi:MAG: PqqD family protein [Thermodesulfobacteriota bacterium]